jgi:hypothetical protein
VLATTPVSGAPDRVELVLGDGGEPVRHRRPRDARQTDRGGGELSPEEALRLLARQHARHAAEGRRHVDEVLVGDVGSQIEAALGGRTVAEARRAAVTLEDHVLNRLERAVEAVAQARGERFLAAPQHALALLADRVELRAPARLADAEGEVEAGRGPVELPLGARADDAEDSEPFAELQDDRSDPAGRALRVVVPVAVLAALADAAPLAVGERDDPAVRLGVGRAVDPQRGARERGVLHRAAGGELPASLEDDAARVGLLSTHQRELAVTDRELRTGAEAPRRREERAEKCEDGDDTASRNGHAVPPFHGRLWYAISPHKPPAHVPGRLTGRGVPAVWRKGPLNGAVTTASGPRFFP